jgi:hypothetical protein
MADPQVRVLPGEAAIFFPGNLENRRDNQQGFARHSA